MALVRASALAWGLVLAIGAGAFAQIAWTTLRYPHEVAVSEGAVGLAVDSVRHGVPLYAAVRWTRTPFVIVHYTPLYYLITAAVSLVTDPGFFSGRLVSIAFTLLTSVVAGTITWRLTRSAFSALSAAALWLSFYPVAFWGTIQRVDAPAIFFEATGILIYLRARSSGRAGFGAIPWFVLAWLTKQVMFVGLLACIADLWPGDRRGAARFAAAGWGSILGIFAALTAWSHGGFWTATVLGTVSRRADTPWVIRSNAGLFFGSPWNLAMLVAAAAGAWIRPRHRFLGIYLGLGMIVAIATDANLPRFFPPILAMSILVPLLIHALRVSIPRRTAVLGALVLVGLSHLVYETADLRRERLQCAKPNQRLTLAELARRHAKGTGPVLAQDVGMLLSAGLPVTMADPLVFSILTGNGAWNPELLAAGLREKRYDAVILNRPIESVADSEWTTLWISGPARRAIEENYALAETVTIDETWRFLETTRYVYVPKERP